MKLLKMGLTGINGNSTDDRERDELRVSMKIKIFFFDQQSKMDEPPSIR
jgi:hypothetical protein